MTSTSTPLEKFEEVTSYLDTARFQDQRKKVLALLGDTETPSDVRILICNWFFELSIVFTNLLEMKGKHTEVGQ